jgi:hypothetical protein
MLQSDIKLYDLSMPVQLGFRIIYFKLRKSVQGTIHIKTCTSSMIFLFDA